jgi:septal ring-binding cell division protein DamX
MSTRWARALNVWGSVASSTALNGFSRPPQGQTVVAARSRMTSNEVQRRRLAAGLQCAYMELDGVSPVFTQVSSACVISVGSPKPGPFARRSDFSASTASVQRPAAVKDMGLHRQ